MEGKKRGEKIQSGKRKGGKEEGNEKRKVRCRLGEKRTGGEEGMKPERERGRGEKNGRNEEGKGG